MNDDEILAIGIDELIKRFKELGCWTYRSSNPDMVIVVSMITRAVAKIAYAKGVKRGKSIGSHQAYDYFIRKEHWVDSYDLSGDFWCPLCGQEVGDEAPL